MPVKDAGEVFSNADPHYDFKGTSLKPWHLSASYQFFDSKGNPGVQGTWEYWWAGPKLWRSSWTREGITRTDWATADGRILHKESGGSLKYFERQLPSLLLFPLPPPATREGDRMKLSLRMVPAGNVTLACVDAQLQWIVAGKPTAPDSATPDVYCFDPSNFALRLKYSESLTTEFDRILAWQGKYLARHVVITASKLKLFTLSVNSIEDLNSDNPALTPAADAVVSQEPVTQPADDQTASSVAAGSLVKKSPPIYPMIAKASRIQGTVVLAAVIGTDGRIRDLGVVTSPASILSDAAVDSVKKWQYKPYFLNGEPVEVETLINVMFRLGN